MTLRSAGPPSILLSTALIYTALTSAVRTVLASTVLVARSVLVASTVLVARTALAGTSLTGPALASPFVPRGRLPALGTVATAFTTAAPRPAGAVAAALTGSLLAPVSAALPSGTWVAAPIRAPGPAATSLISSSTLVAPCRAARPTALTRTSALTRTTALTRITTRAGPATLTGTPARRRAPRATGILRTVLRVRGPSPATVRAIPGLSFWPSAS